MTTQKTTSKIATAMTSTGFKMHIKDQAQSGLIFFGGKLVLDLRKN